MSNTGGELKKEGGGDGVGVGVGVGVGGDGVGVGVGVGVGGDGVGGRVGSVSSHWYWAGAGAVQLIWGILSYRKGVAADSRIMPFKAFAVASLFVGAGASATMFSLKSFGIHSIDDMKALGENVRTGLGKSP